MERSTKLVNVKVNKRKGSMASSQSLLKKVLVNEHARATNSPTFGNGQIPQAPMDEDDLDTSNELKYPLLTLITWILYILLWFTLLLIAAHFEFGAVFSVLSLLCVIWLNTRDWAQETRGDQRILRLQPRLPTY